MKWIFVVLVLLSGFLPILTGKKENANAEDVKQETNKKSYTADAAQDPAAAGTQSEDQAKQNEKAKSKEQGSEPDASNTTANITGKIPKIPPEDMYRRLFRQKRISHMEAVKTILALDNYIKQYKMVSLVLERLFKVMGEAKIKLMEAGFMPGDPFPTDEAVRDAFSHVAENTAFLGDILLRLPAITHDLLKNHKEWDLVIKWSISFCNLTQIYEGIDNKILNLMAQELEVIDRDPNYVNPFKEEGVQFQDLDGEAGKGKKDKKKKKKKKKKQKGPRMSSGEL